MSQDTPHRPFGWTSMHACVLAIICLLLGILVGYLVRGPQPAVQGAPATVQSAESTPAGISQLAPEGLKRMADKQAGPVLAQLKAKPDDLALLVQAGNIYYDARQFNDAIDYYSRALAADADNTDVRTDRAAAYWFLGDADRAIAELGRVLNQQPNKPNALLNRGIIRWQGKMDVKGAVADWENLLKADPNFPQRSEVERLIAQAKKHSSMKPNEKTSKPAM